MTIYLVLGPGLVLAAYTREDSAELHRRCITGAKVVSCDLLDTVPESIREDLVEWDDDEDTPLEEMEPTRPLRPFRKDR